MRAFDVNVLVYAHRADSPHHDACRRFVEGETTGPSLFGVPALALSGFLRVTTHPRVFTTPSSLRDALDFVEALTARANCMIMHPGPRHWGVFVDLLLQSHGRGNLVPDAYLAAMAIETGSDWVTTDRGFARFPGLRTVDPRNNPRSS